MIQADKLLEVLQKGPKTELKTRNGHRIITKIKCRDFVGSNA